MVEMRRHLLAAVVLLSSCTGERLPDLPKRPTAVTQTYFHNLGFKGMFASETTTTVSTRADRRREENSFKFSGFVMKHLTSAKDGSTIWRVDKNKVWRLDPKAKTYQECPLAGCPRAAHPEKMEHAQRQEPPREKPKCALTLAKHRFSVEPTSEAKEINGFSTKRHKVAWEIVLQDKNKRKNTSLVSVDVWTTPENNPRFEAVKAVERGFEAKVRAAAAVGEGMARVIPPEAMKVIAMQFLTDLTPDQRATVTAASQELAKIKGRPVLTHLEWNMGGDACSEGDSPAKPAKREKQGLDFTSVGGFLGSAASRGAQNKMEAMSDKPVFAFDQELRKVEITDATDGLFVVPPAYTLVPR